jgi:hypothetical protein
MMSWRGSRSCPNRRAARQAKDLPELSNPPKTLSELLLRLPVVGVFGQDKDASAAYE